ncbi:phosphotransferase [Conexibacter stalactiti]|uniref:Phosphotransferase n=1 Tax=Conexibacter stalactiti TaxID=1940611 RepID=A0ABU4HN17_9ACTN|nr:phosphotransferase [Conexibacter stalactiti]MDW5593945.1 phosphotransferase [Conexibacter stalactiti]MEC5034587.1 phosphotransferase [Conexibacter stalactiti]
MTPWRQRREPLAGGLVNAGAVVRTGDLVERPAGPYTDSVHALLRGLRAAGFDGAPLPVGRGPGPSETLSFIRGDVPLPPLPRWARGEAALRSVAALLRRCHEAAAGFRPPLGASWSTELADPHGGPLTCHGDVCPQNVVFRDGRAVALLDFDHAAPGRAVFDLAQTAKLWLALGMPDDRTRAAVEPLDGLRVLAEGYGLPAEERLQLVAALGDAIAVGDRFVTRRVEREEPAFVAMWRDGGRERMLRRREWFERERRALEDALGSAPR